MRSPVRMVFGFIVHLHPHEFRIEFGDEILWIFDEQMKDGEQGAARVVLYVKVLLDMLCSAFIQHTLREQPRAKTVGPHFGQLGSSARVIQVAQGGFIIFSCLFSTFSIALCLYMVMSSFQAFVHS